ncbi:hypothetical protein [Actinomadura rubrisoli]|uniref:Uncharacterized protein n=1 Tax=Actinomadura rubrisoli TaxID=2530368 RepID=A0A4R5BDM7_9ACTN|nr:hypothetical protein [Actinomadura rubrisoli]TDD84321.1 hypothetical protein E1298_20190 [Actinomadura rubrisoli]
MAQKHLDELAASLTARDWTCGLVETCGDVLLRLHPPAWHGDPDRVVDVVVRDRGEGPYFAYARTPRRSITPVDLVGKAVRAIIHVHGGALPRPPFVPPALAGFAAALNGEPSRASP